MKILPVWVGTLLLGLVPLVGAESVYRSVGADGQVIFSDSPPSDAKSSETVDLLPPLSEERLKEAEARQQKLIELVSPEPEEEEPAEETAVEDKLTEAKQAVEDARKRVDQAKAIRPDDWWMGVGSGQLLPKYQERVRQAEQELEAAERNLRLVRSGQR
jgi:hypothetical protein